LEDISCTGIPLSSQDTLVCSVLFGPTSIVCFDRQGAVFKVVHVEISAQGAVVRRAIPLSACLLLTVISPETTNFASEVFPLVQVEGTISVTIERDALISVVKLKISSPTPNDQITALEATFLLSFCTFKLTALLGVFSAIFPVDSLALVRALFCVRLKTF